MTPSPRAISRSVSPARVTFLGRGNARARARTGRDSGDRTVEWPRIRAGPRTIVGPRGAAGRQWARPYGMIAVTSPGRWRASASRDREATRTRTRGRPSSSRREPSLWTRGHPDETRWSRIGNMTRRVTANAGRGSRSRSTSSATRRRGIEASPSRTSARPSEQPLRDTPEPGSPLNPERLVELLRAVLDCEMVQRADVKSPTAARISEAAPYMRIVARSIVTCMRSLANRDTCQVEG